MVGFRVLVEYNSGIPNGTKREFLREYYYGDFKALSKRTLLIIQGKRKKVPMNGSLKRYNRISCGTKKETLTIF